VSGGSVSCTTLTSSSNASIGGYLAFGDQALRLKTLSATINASGDVPTTANIYHGLGSASRIVNVTVAVVDGPYRYFLLPFDFQIAADASVVFFASSLPAGYAGKTIYFYVWYTA
jgi:hypothetical protein